MASFLTISFVACGSPSGGSSSPSTDAEAAADIANHYCRRLDGCAHFDLEFLYGDLDACVARTTPLWSSTLRAQSTGLNRGNADACAKGYDTLDCDDVRFEQPPACGVGGSLGDGFACGADSQCVNGYCKMDYFEACGTCASRLSVGGTCTRSENCRPGLGCVGETVPGRCAVLAPLGAACTEVPCAPSLTCVVGVCAAPLGLDAACTVNPDGCDFDQGLFCDSNTLKCAPKVIVSTGGTCGDVSTCAASGVCDNDQLCQPPVADGAPCVDLNACQYPAQCIDGVCVMQDPATCH